MTHLSDVCFSLATPDDGVNLKDLIIRHARDAHKATLFNHASMAYNNHFMFSSLAPNPHAPSTEFLKKINEDFSSLDSLRETFIATANAMFGPGFTWLIKREPLKKLSILNTYIAGSPFPGAHYRQQPIDVATALPAYKSDIGSKSMPGEGSMVAGYLGDFSVSKRSFAPGGVDLTPLTCASTWEHCWLMNHGLGGKRAYLEAFWESIDWRVVEANFGQVNAIKVQERSTEDSFNRAYPFL